MAVTKYRNGRQRLSRLVLLILNPHMQAISAANQLFQWLHALGRQGNPQKVCACLTHTHTHTHTQAHTDSHTRPTWLWQYLAKCRQVEAKARFLFFSHSVKADVETEPRAQAKHTRVPTH